MRLLLLLLSRQVALILDFAANARRMSNTKNVYPRTPSHTHTHPHTNTHRVRGKRNLYAFHWLRSARLDSAQLPCLPWQRLRLSQLLLHRLLLLSFSHCRIRSAALYAMHFSALLTLERALGQSGRDPGSSTSPSCRPHHACSVSIATQLPQQELVSSLRASVCECVCVYASVVCLKGYVRPLCVCVCVFASTLPQAF